MNFQWSHVCCSAGFQRAQTPVFPVPECPNSRAMTITVVSCVPYFVAESGNIFSLTNLHFPV